MIGDGAVGPCGVIAAKRLGAEQIVIFGRHRDRTDLALEFGATDVGAERGREASERFREITAGRKADGVLECVGLGYAMRTAVRWLVQVERSAVSGCRRTPGSPAPTPLSKRT